MEIKSEVSLQPDGPRRKCVLIVDDDVLICDVLAGLFANLGYDTVTAEDGEVACDFIARANLALAVVDPTVACVRGRRECPSTIMRPEIVLETPATISAC